MKLYPKLCLTESDLGNLHCSFPHKVHWYRYNLVCNEPAVLQRGIDIAVDALGSLA